ncbi:biotin-dependent carboxyltransferase family protein [Pectobacterium sp. B2J-2]|uniref:5-oxoprolinase subunit C family protein n=1 Tax=Pectobacterium sp. B2J-2 TaxID=3385372 RepID=UPI0038FBF91E
MTINVIKPGLATTVQDAGREGYYHLGIPPSGALDPYSMQMANLLVGNDPNEAVLEMTLLGPALSFSAEALVAVCGAGMTPIVDNQPAATHTALLVRAGQQLTFSPARQGCRAYLAVAGGVDVPCVLGSRATYTLGALGGFQGRRLAAGDTLSTGAADNARFRREGKRVPDALLPVLEKSVTLRLMPGLYIHRLTESAVDNFFAASWYVSTEADRTGYRLKGGQPLDFKLRTPPFGAGSDPSNIVDACYPIGSVQVPGGLEPIVLLRDAVSGGGYMTLGTVISPDLAILGQLQPNQHVRFMPVTLEEALVARCQFQQRLAQLANALR